MEAVRTGARDATWRRIRTMIDAAGDPLARDLNGLRGRRDLKPTERKQLIDARLGRGRLLFALSARSGNVARTAAQYATAASPPGARHDPRRHARPFGYRDRYRYRAGRVRMGCFGPPQGGACGTSCSPLPTTIKRPLLETEEAGPNEYLWGA